MQRFTLVTHRFPKKLCHFEPKTEVPDPAKVISVFELDISIHSGHLQWTVVKLSDSVGVLDPWTKKITYQALITMAFMADT